MSEDSVIHCDATVIQAVLAGETERFDEIVNRYQSALLRFATSRLGSSDGVEEIVQETLLCTFKSLHSYNSQYSFRTWLWTILINQCRRHVKRRSRVPRVWSWSEAPASEKMLADEMLSASQGFSNSASLRSELPSPPAALIAKEQSEQLEALMQQLPAAQADALRLRFFAGLKFQEIADTMGCSLSSAKNRVRWGLSKISEKMLSGEVV